MIELWHNLNNWKRGLKLFVQILLQVYNLCSISLILIVVTMRHLNTLCIYFLIYKMRIVLVSTSWNNEKLKWINLYKFLTRVSGTLEDTEIDYYNYSCTSENSSQEELAATMIPHGPWQWIQNWVEL